jgi:YfiH family protein
MTLPAVKEGRFVWRETAAASYLTPAVLLGQPRLQCAFTLRHAGRSGRDLNLSFDLAAREDVLANRQHVLRALGLPHSTVHTVRQVHGNRVCVVDREALAHGLRNVRADALVTDLPQVPLGVLAADCLPIVLYSLRPRALGIVHAGRMGTLARVVPAALEAMRRQFAVAPEQVYAVVGPGIGPCCYRLDARALAPFQERFSDWEQYFIPRGPGVWMMHLAKANLSQLRAAGVPSAHVQIADVCTACHVAHFYSHRAEGKEAGRAMGIAVLQP